MGADLYIESVYRPNHDKYKKLFHRACIKRDIKAKTEDEKKKVQAEVDKYFNLMYDKGYFRDPYNSCNVLWQMGLSWWTDCGDLLNKRTCCMSPINAKRFKKMIEERPLSSFNRWKRTKNGKKFVDRTDPLEDWYEYFVEARQELIDFLNQAIEMKEPIWCSI